GEVFALFDEPLGLGIGLVEVLRQGADVVGGQDGATVPDGGLHGGSTLRGVGLPGQRPQLAVQLIGEVLEAVEVGLHADEFALRLLLAPAVLQHASGLLDEGAALIGLGLQDLGEPSLTDDDVHFAADARVAEQLLDIHEPGLGAVDLVFAGPVAEHATGDRDLGVLDWQLAVGVVDDEGDLRAPQRFAVTGAGEDDVLHLAAAQGLRPLL